MIIALINCDFLFYRSEQCSKASVYNMKTALLEEMNKTVKRIVESEQEVIKLNACIEQKILEMKKKNENKT